jgi:glycosyltransferase involved in cell wall biosynthesis
MKVLLIANFAPDRQESMLRLSAALQRGLEELGIPVETHAPQPCFARLVRTYRYSGFPKLLGYLDKFVLFPRKLRRLAARAGPDVIAHLVDHANAVYVPHLRGLPTLVTCHDLMQIRCALGEVPGRRTGRGGTLYQKWILKALARSPEVICVSAATRSQLSRLTGRSEEEFPVMHPALNHPFRRLERDEAQRRLERFGDPIRRGGFLLNVSGEQWYKNREGLVRIHAELPPSTGELVIAGKPLGDDVRSLSAALGTSSRVHEAADVSNDELEALYSLARALIFPSWDEGFGWPVIEAQACGCPVFASRNGPLPEVGGEGAVYFDPADSAGAARIIMAGLENADELRKRGYANMARFAGRTLARDYLDHYRRILASAHGVRAD